MDTTFSLKDLGTLDYFLGIEVKKQLDGFLLLTQGKYIRDLLQKHNLHEAHPFPTPMVATNKLSKSGSDPFKDPFLYIEHYNMPQLPILTSALLSTKYVSSRPNP